MPDDNKQTKVCERCGRKVASADCERVGLAWFCSECADEYTIDQSIKMMLSTPGGL